MLFKYSKNKASVLEWFWWYKALLAPKRPRFNLLDHLKQLHVEFTLESKVIKIDQDGIVYEKHNQLEILSHFDTIVLAFGSKANQDLYQEIKEEHVHLIGDASKAGDAKKAIFESTQLALKL